VRTERYKSVPKNTENQKKHNGQTERQSWKKNTEMAKKCGKSQKPNCYLNSREFENTLY